MTSFESYFKIYILQNPPNTDLCADLKEKIVQRFTIKGRN